MSTEIQTAGYWRQLAFLRWQAFEDMTAQRDAAQSALSAKAGEIASQAAEIEALRDLLNEVRACFTRDDDLPDDLLPRIDAAMQTKEAS